MLREVVVVQLQLADQGERRGCVRRPENEASSPSATATCSRRPDGRLRISFAARPTSARAAAAVAGSIDCDAAASGSPSAPPSGPAIGGPAGALPASAARRAASCCQSEQTPGHAGNDVPILMRLVGNDQNPAGEPISPRPGSVAACACSCSPGTASRCSTSTASSTAIRRATGACRRGGATRPKRSVCSSPRCGSTSASSHASRAHRRRPGSPSAPAPRRRRASSTASSTTSGSASSRGRRSTTTGRGSTGAAATIPSPVARA